MNCLLYIPITLQSLNSLMLIIIMSNIVPNLALSIHIYSIDLLIDFDILLFSSLTIFFYIVFARLLD